MAKIRAAEREAILQAIGGGVTPRKGIQHIQVGRVEETATIVKDIATIKAGGGATRFVISAYGGGKTFFLTLTKKIALQQNLLVMTADFSPDRRLYASDGKAVNLYRELIRSLSSAEHPDGGALGELLDACVEKIIARDADFIDELRKLPYGYDAATVLFSWAKATEGDDFFLKDACLRWFSAENTTENKRTLGIKSSIGDDGAYDALKLIAHMASSAGYGGVLVELDECINLFEIVNSTSRRRNYEQILRIFNECLQGNARHIGFVFGGTPEFFSDTRKGLCSYDALRSRLAATDYASSESRGPVIDLKPLTPEDLMVLLGNIVNVEALGNRDDWLMEDPGMEMFLEKQYNTLGADYYRTPREILREFVDLVMLLRSNPEMTVEDAVGEMVVSQPSKASAPSGLGMKMVGNKPLGDKQEEPEDDEFGF